jgi:hypothetical protein
MKPDELQILRDSFGARSASLDEVKSLLTHRRLAR